MTTQTLAAGPTLRGASRRAREAMPGHQVASAALYEQFVDSIYSYVLHCCHDPILAEDIVAETFLRAIEHLPRFEQRGVPISAWLYRIATNVTAAHYRRAPALPWDGYDHDTMPDERPGPEYAVLGDERRHEVRAAVAALPLTQRQAIALRYGRDLSYKEIAHALGRSEGAIKQHLHRAHSTLQRRLTAGYAC